MNIEERLAKARQGCCDSWPKPCTYHEGYESALYECYAPYDFKQELCCPWNREYKDPQHPEKGYRYE